MRYVDELSETVRASLAHAYRSKDLLGYGLRKRLAEGYTMADFRADALAALVVGVIALPLSMALAIAAGVSPEHGLYTAIVAGIVCALLGGTRFQVTGPTAAFVVILLPIVHTYHLGGLLVAGMMAGVILLLMGLMRFGRLMQFIPHPVTTGFTAGIAVVIALLQLKYLLGIDTHGASGTIDTVAALWDGRGAISYADLGTGIATIALLIGVPKVITRIPAPLIALVVVSVGCVVISHFVPGFAPATIGSTFETTLGNQTIHGIPPLPPVPVVPWHGTGFSLSYETVRQLLPSAFAIAMLGAIESLMAATVADGMSGTTHDPNSELIALGIANIIVPFFGGIAATGALARTATNIRAGARSPIAAVLHAVFVLACTIALAPLVAYLPMAALGGLLVVVARNMADARHFVRLARIAPRSDVVVMIVCFGLTVAFDMVIAVTVGVVLAALLFMRRMAVLTKIDLAPTNEADTAIPRGVRLYEIAGPMFFGAAQRAMQTLASVGSSERVVILSMRAVPTMDATGLVALESALDRLFRSGIKVIFAGLTPEVADMLERAGIRRDPGRLAYAPDLDTAISMAIVHTARGDRPAAA